MKKSILSLLILSGVLLASDFARDDEKEVVIDYATNLMWQDNRDVSDSNMTYYDSITFCEDSTAGGYDDWRLPNINELKSIVDYTTTGYPVQSSVFKNYYTYMWSSSYTYGIALDAWIIDFANGDEKHLNKRLTPYPDPINYRVSCRCVRDD